MSPAATPSTHDVDADERNAEIKIHVNGDIVHRDEARVSVYDSGFLLGDGVWEGIRLYRGRWAFLDEHLDRLFEAAKAIDLDIGLDRDGVTQGLNDTARANAMTDNVHARLMVTRGVKAKPFQDPRLSLSGPTIIIMEHSQPSESTFERGIRLHTVPHIRGAPMTQDPKINSHSKLNCILAGIHAQKAGADEALMLDLHRFRQHHQLLQFLYRARATGMDLDRRLLHERHHSTQGHRDMPRQRDPGVRTQFFTGGHLRRRGSVHHRHLRRANAGHRN